MFKQLRPRTPYDLFTPLSGRSEQGVYFIRLTGYDRQMEDFILRFYDSARRSGVILEGGLPNPDNDQLAYYNEIMGASFAPELGFITAALKKWLPRMNELPRENVAQAVCTTLDGLRRAGKNDAMLKNAYIKFMCWLYYKFERIANALGRDDLPKILCEGPVSVYALMLLSVLSRAGCDILLLEYDGGEQYRKTDPESVYSTAFEAPGLGAFPEGFCLKQLRERAQKQAETDRLYGPAPQRTNCTNAWLDGDLFEAVRSDPARRGSDPALFCNCFARVVGVKDPLTCTEDLYRLQQSIRQSGRHLVIVNETLGTPTTEEIAAIRHGTYANVNQLITGLSPNLTCLQDGELQKLARRAFVDLLLAEEKQPGMNLNRLTGRAVYLLCWLRRWQQELFAGRHDSDLACFIYLGGCRDEHEALFCSFLARLPADVLIFVPDTARQCCLKDDLLYQVTYPQSAKITRFPEGADGNHIRTAAYQAERELDTLMYNNSGLYRTQQYARAETVVLQTMYEEIPLLWDQELPYRPSFAVNDEIVNIPVIFGKVCGVKDGNVTAYWSGIRALLTDDTVLVTSVPQVTGTTANPMKAFAVEFLKKGRLQRRLIREHKNYPYGILREEMQEHLLDKLQQLIDSRVIKGTFENGTEYTIVSTALGLETDLLRRIQRFDFTKKNPKLIYIITNEAPLSLEDTVRAVFLNTVGFDVLFFVPTGYRCVEKYLARDLFTEHRIGEYVYDLHVPDFKTIPLPKHGSWRDKLFGRGK